MLIDKIEMVSEHQALAGRDQSIAVPAAHFVNGNSMQAPFPERFEFSILGLGCFWGAEKVFWQLDGVFSTMAGYAGGFTPNPSYQEVCSGQTGHNEVVQVVFDPAVISFSALLTAFFENHDPTQGMRQGNDRGTQYRSGIYCNNEVQLQLANAAKVRYQQALTAVGAGSISTEIVAATAFYYAEDYHQQYLAKNPQGYCGLGGTGVCMS